MLNRIIIMGRLTCDPELRHTQTGPPVASFTLAVDRDFKDKQTGEEPTDFIDIVAWRQTGEFVSSYFTKGRMAEVVADTSTLEIRNGRATAAAVMEAALPPHRPTLPPRAVEYVTGFILP